MGAPDGDELADFRRSVSGLLANLEPAPRARLLRRVARDLRRSQQARIAAQRAPDGAAWEKRKPRRPQKAAARPIRFLYRKPDGEVRLVDMRSWVRRGAMLTGFDREAGAVRTFRADRIARHLPAEGGADSGPVPRERRDGLKPATRAMFRKLRADRHLKAGGGPDEAWVAFTGRAERIARIHHFGLRDRVAPGGPETDYPRRELLGFSPADEDAVMAAIIEHLARAKGGRP